MGGKIDGLCLSSSEVKNGRHCTSTPPYNLHNVVLNNHRNNLNVNLVDLTGHPTGHLPVLSQYILINDINDLRRQGLLFI
jgi:hypothetical protein